ALVATVARATTFPLSTVDVEVWSDAGPWHAAEWNGLAGVAEADGRTCANQLSPEHGAHFYLCSTGAGSTGSTTFGYTRFGGTVTYHSVVFGREWNEATGEETVWSWNDRSEDYLSGGQRRPLGSAVSVRLDVTDGIGAMPVNATVPLRPFESTVVVKPYACRQEPMFWIWGGFKTVCEGTTHLISGWSGEAAG
ncbi:MAG TPA: hypothetical protein VGX50_15140, partial [Longimicrobium sp.]|nr:hypothetical protein [Longimicrobium sp.]